MFKFDGNFFLYKFYDSKWFKSMSKAFKQIFCNLQNVFFISNKCIFCFNFWIVTFIFIFFFYDYLLTIYYAFKCHKNLFISFIPKQTNMESQLALLLHKSSSEGDTVIKTQKIFEDPSSGQ